MSDHREKPGSPGDILHYGVKGMKWGHRKKEDTGTRDVNVAGEAADRNAAAKGYITAQKKMTKPTPEEALKNLEKNYEKFDKKFEASNGTIKAGTNVNTVTGEIKGLDQAKRKGLSPGQKKALMYTGGAVVLVGGTYLAGKHVKGKADLWMNLLNEGGDPKKIGLDSWDQVKDLAGKPVDGNTFHGLVGHSQGKTWLGETSYMTDAAFARPAYEIPAGSTFYRLSTSAEKDFMPTTYATHSLDDFNRYVAGFRHEKGLVGTFQRVTWKNTAPVKVPDLTTVLGQLHSAMEEQGKNPGSYYHGMKIDQQTVMKEYQAMSGGGWSSTLSQGLISRLKEQGYGAIVDEMDAGVIGETPIVFFDTAKAAPKSNMKFGKKEIDAAEKLLRELDDPPGRKM